MRLYIKTLLMEMLVEFLGRAKFLVAAPERLLMGESML
jgi:hypothetical protein